MPQALANKYRNSWLRSSESQRQDICIRFGLTYTHALDEALLIRVAQHQQADYLKSKLNKEFQQVKQNLSIPEKKSNEVDTATIIKSLQGQAKNKRMAKIKA